jgi:hypothetical protein
VASVRCRISLSLFSSPLASALVTIYSSILVVLLYHSTEKNSGHNYNNEPIVVIKMPWFINWPGRKKKSVDFNAFLISKAKQQKEESNLLEVQRQNGVGQGAMILSNPQDNHHKQQQQPQLQPVASFFASALSARSRATSFSLVLTDEDLKGLEVQRKLEELRRQGKEVQIARQQELLGLRTVLNEQKGTIREQWDQGIEWSEYLEIAIRSMDKRETEGNNKKRGSTSSDDKDPSSSTPSNANSGDDNEDEGDDDDVQGVAAGRANATAVVTDTAVRGSREADLMKACHRADIQDRLRKLLQEQTGDEIMRVYQMGPTMKEEFSEKEAKIVSEMVQMAVVLEEQKAYNEKRVDLYQQIKARYEQAAKDHVNRVYKALREKSDEGEEVGQSMTKGGVDGTSKKRPSMMAKSYSARVLAVNAEEKEEQRIRRESIRKESVDCLSIAAALLDEDEEDEDNEGTTLTAPNDSQEVQGEAGGTSKHLRKSIAESATETKDMGSIDHDHDSSEKENGDMVESITMEARNSHEIHARNGIKAGAGVEDSSRTSAAVSHPRVTPTPRTVSSDRIAARSSGPSNVRRTMTTTPHTAVRPTSRVVSSVLLNERRLSGESQARPVGSVGRPTTTTASRLTRPGAHTTSTRMAASSIGARRAVSTGAAE